MDLLTAYDRFLHDKLMNPAFRWVQKLFHWNRFQLIRSFIIAEFMCDAAVAVAYVGAAVQTRDITWLVCGCGMVFPLYRKAVDLRDDGVSDELQKASQTFEDNRRVILPKVLLARALRSKEWRRWDNVFASLPFLGLPYVYVSQTDAQFAGLIALTLMLLARAVETHLWDIDDIDPRDREYLFEGKRSQEPAN